MHAAPTFAALCKYVVWLSLRCPCVVPVPECLAQLHDVAWVTMCKEQRTNAATNSCYKPAAASNCMHDAVCTVFKCEVAVLCNFNFACRMVVPNHMTLMGELAAGKKAVTKACRRVPQPSPFTMHCALVDDSYVYLCIYIYIYILCFTIV